MKVIFLAHPVRDVDGYTLEQNLERAERWYRWICDSFPGVSPVAPWIISCRVFDDADADQRDAGLVRNEAVIEACDEVWLVGGRVTSGMARERDHALASGKPVIDMTSHLGLEPPAVGQ